MEGQQKTAGPQPNVFGLHESLGHQEVGRGMWFPWCSVMLAYPALLVAQFVEPTYHLEIPLVAILERPLGRMRRRVK